MPGRRPRFFYGYVIGALGFFIQAIFWGTYRSFGLFFNPLLNEFGWTRAELSTAASIGWLLIGFVNIPTGALTDRFGPRITLTACGFFFGLGYILLWQLHALWQLYLFYGFIMAIGMSGADIIPLSTIARWFASKRGTFTGISKIGTGLGMMAVPLLAGQFITGYGWRSAYAILGTAALVTLVGMAQFLRRDPSRMGQQPYGARRHEPSASHSGEEGMLLKQAYRTRQFWTLAAAFLCLVFCAETVMVHTVPHAVDQGISATSAAAILSVIGGASIVARSIMGFVADRIGAKRAMLICYLPLISALFWLQSTDALWMFYVFAALYGFSHGGFFTLISPTIAQLFGTVSHGAIFGIILASGAVGGAGGPFMAGRLFDIYGTYRIPFLIIALLAIAALLLTLSLTRTAYEKQASAT
ncbi:MAG: MFS transporter [Chloroflexota bacterium]|jgi:MFS family permease